MTAVATFVAAWWGIGHGGWSLLFARLVDGVTNGALYGISAMSLVIVYKATRIINFAQGAMAVVGTYLAFSIDARFGIPVVVSIAVAMAVSAAGAAAIERTCIRRFPPDDHFAIVVVTLAWFLILGQGAAVVWGFTIRTMPTPFPARPDDYVTIFDTRVRIEHIATIATVIVVTVVVSLILRYSRFGLAFRSVASNVDASRVAGLDVGAVVRTSWALAAAIGTLGGCLVARSTFLEPNFMGRALVFGFAAATLGGLDSVGGALIGGVIIGVAVAYLGGYVPFIGDQFSLVAALVLIVIVLQLRPAGLFGTKTVDRV